MNYLHGERTVLPGSRRQQLSSGMLRTNPALWPFAKASSPMLKLRNYFTMTTSSFQVMGTGSGCSQAPAHVTCSRLRGLRAPAPSPGVSLSPVSLPCSLSHSGEVAPPLSILLFSSLDAVTGICSLPEVCPIWLCLISAQMAQERG